MFLSIFEYCRGTRSIIPSKNIKNYNYKIKDNTPMSITNFNIIYLFIFWIFILIIFSNVIQSKAKYLEGGDYLIYILYEILYILELHIKFSIIDIYFFQNLRGCY